MKAKVEEVQQYLKNIAAAQGSVKEFLANVADTVTEFVNKVMSFFQNLFG